MNDRVVPPNDSATDLAENYLALPEYSDEAIASHFVLRYLETYRYVSPWGRWLYYDGTRWVHDRTLRAPNAMRTMCAELARAVAMDTGMAQKTRDSVATQIASAQKIYSALKLAAGDRLISKDSDAWDADHWLLNTPDGTLNLKTAALMPHDREHYITKRTAAGPRGDCPLWRELLRQWTDGDEELIAFLQRFVGYALTGTISEHALLFFYGSGANGKSTFLNTIIELLGDYCTVAAIETFIETQGERHPAHLAFLHGARLVVAQETEEGRRWATSIVKSVTSGDVVTARYMRQDFFSFKPTCKLLFAGNHRPGLRNVDEAMRRRINLVPFKVTIAPDKRDPSLPDRLRTELPGILAWALEGCIEWQEKGLATPESVRAATADYLSEEDVLAVWVEETIDQDPQGFVRVADLHANYQTWAKRFGERFMGLKRFSQVIEDRGFERGKHPVDRTRGFNGIKLIASIGETEQLR